MKKVLLLVSAFLLLGSLPASAQTNSAPDVAPGKLIKAAHSSAVYFVDADLTRHAFPNERVFKSWYSDFALVIVVPDSALSEYPLAGLVPYKAAKRLVKLTTDPKVYAVDDGGVLRWVKTEKLAKALYGDDWQTFVDDLDDSFFANYIVGDDIDGEESFRSDDRLHLKDIKSALRAKRFRHLQHRDAGDDEFEHGGFGKNKVAVCHNFGENGEHTIYIAAPAVPAHLNHGDTTGPCGGDETANDATAPEIDDEVIVGIADTSAAVELTTDEDATVTVYYGTATPVNLATADSATSAASGTDHSILLDGLDPETTYYVVIEAMDAAGNISTTEEMTFTTEASADTTAPGVVSNEIDEITDASATVHVTTDEDATVTVHYATATPVDTATAESVESATLATSHSLELSGLAAETTYYVLVVVTDAAGNEASTTEMSFTTLAAPDTTAPTILTQVTDTITDTGATVHLTTNESTTAKVYYGTTASVDTGTAESEESTTLATSHDLALAGLTAETMYYVLVVVEDEAGNETTATETTFTTIATP